MRKMYQSVGENPPAQTSRPRWPIVGRSTIKEDNQEKALIRIADALENTADALENIAKLLLEREVEIDGEPLLDLLIKDR